MKFYRVNYGGIRDLGEIIVLENNRLENNRVVGGRHTSDGGKFCPACGHFYIGRECGCRGYYIPGGYGDWKHDRENKGRLVPEIPEDWEEIGATDYCPYEPWD